MKKVAILYTNYSPVIDAIKYQLSGYQIDCMKELEETKTKLQDAESKIAQKDAIIEQMRNEQKKMAQKDEIIRKMRKILKEANIDFPEDDEFNKNNEKEDKENKK